LDFIEGLNLTDAVKDYAYRFTDAVKTAPVVGSVLTWSSCSIDRTNTTYSRKITADIMIGLGALPGYVNVPISLFAYGFGLGAVDVDVLSFANILLSAKPKLNAAFEGGVVAMAALNMQEVDPDGNVVGDDIPLLLPALSPACSEELTYGDSGNVSGLSCTYTPSGTTADVTVTYVTTKKAGVLKYGKTRVSPRSYEMIIEVEDFPLTDAKNHIRLNVGLLTSSATATVKGNALVVPRIGNTDELYITLSNETTIDDKQVEVKINMDAAAPYLSGVAELIMKAALGEDNGAKIAHIDFPAGAKSFIYDPAIGAGKDVYSAGIVLDQGSQSAHSSASPASSGKGPEPSPVPSNVYPLSSDASSVALSLLVALVSILICLF